jgi:competence protein ComGC
MCGLAKKSYKLGLLAMVSCLVLIVILMATLARSDQEVILVLLCFLATVGLAIVAFICGLVALVRIGRSHGRLMGREKAVRGLIYALVPFLLLAVVVPNIVKARTTSSHNACINNLRQIDGAKEQWALENKKTSNDTPQDSDLFGTDKYVKFKPSCPAGGTYSLNSMGQKPACSIGLDGHTLP